MVSSYNVTKGLEDAACDLLLYIPLHNNKKCIKVECKSISPGQMKANPNIIGLIEWLREALTLIVFKPVASVVLLVFLSLLTRL